MLALLSAFALAAGDPPTIEAAPGRGIRVTSADGRFALHLGARFQLRQSLFLAPPDRDGGRDLSLHTQLYTTRIRLDGHLGSEALRYRLQLAVAERDPRDGAKSPIYDAYFDLAHHPNLSLRVGQMFVPFDRLRTVREFALQLPDRPRAVAELALDRDIGVYAYSDHLGGERSPLAYRIGVFGGAGIHQLEAHPPGGLAVARVELRPLGPIDADSEGDPARLPHPRLAVGLAAAINLAATRVRSTTSAVLVGGTTTYRHLAADAVLKWRGFACEAEVLVRDADRDRIVSRAEDGTRFVEPTRSGGGTVVQPSLMLTDRWEVAARYGRLWASPGTDPAFLAEVASGANELGLGTSLYLDGHRLKVQAGTSLTFGDTDVVPIDGALAAHVLLDATL